jgi:1,4-dihydroxy-2-naphthoate polyprenyltransferase
MKSRGQIWIRLLLYPTHTLPTAAAPVLVAVGLAIRDQVFAPVPVALAMLGSWLIHIAGVFIDNHELLSRHGDISEHPELLLALRRGALTLQALRIVILACIAAAVLAGAYLVALGGSLALAIGAIGIAASISYAGGPLAYARTGLAEPVFFLMFGVVAVASTYFIQCAAMQGPPPDLIAALGKLPADAYILGLPVGLLVTNVLIVDDIRDIAFDTAKGWRTGAVRFGIRWSRARLVTFSVLAYLAPFAFYCRPGFGISVLLPLLTLPMAWMIVRVVCSESDPATLLPITPRASMLSFLYALLLALGTAMSKN